MDEAQVVVSDGYEIAQVDRLPEEGLLLSVVVLSETIFPLIEAWIFLTFRLKLLFFDHTNTHNLLSLCSEDN